MKSFSSFRRDEQGAVMVEMTIAIVLLLTLTLGFVDFGNAYYQWNAATKAVQAGARMASISDPIVPAVSQAGPATSPGAAVPAGSYDYVCNGATSACVCTGASCANGAWVAANFSRIFFGDDGACGPVAGSRPGMCDFFPRLEPENVVVRYTATGLGYQTRPSGSIPTITVSLQDVNFQFFFLSGLLGFDDITMPSMLSTVTGEDMSSTAP
ncbi:TadE/TadG family type IV pilus assembly protein [Mesorhizobium sp. VNQ89]|uniref:TadE/TadG family type IV pilus assembly protein n=1 Tax=Mesorhizobium quangtriensis TaxID=3157709 RepID=UPI0032B7EA1A